MIQYGNGVNVNLSAAAWRKSSTSGPYSDNCVEVADVHVRISAQAAPEWRKSSRSSDSANCVETAATVGGVAVRDSKHPDGGVLLFPQDVWRAFVDGVRSGEFDL